MRATRRPETELTDEGASAPGAALARPGSSGLASLATGSSVLTADGLLALQEAAGNQAVVRTMRRCGVRDSARRLSRTVQGDVLQQSITPSWAGALTDAELARQLAIARRAAVDSGDEATRATALDNLPVLESEAVRRNPAGTSKLEQPPTATTPPSSPPDDAEVERITQRTRELRTTYIGNVARPILDRALDASDYRLTPNEIAGLRTRAESLRQVARAMRDAGYNEDASIMSHIIGDLLTDAKFAEVQWRQLSQSAQNYWQMKRDHPEWQVGGNVLLDMTGAIVQESQSADVQFVMGIFVDAMTVAPPRRPATPSPATRPPIPPELSGEIDKAFADLEAGKIPQGEPAVRAQVRKGGEAAQVGDIGAGPKKVDLGIPPERELVAVERMDKSTAGAPDRILDASGTFPPELYGKYDTLILNNPYKYAPNIAELSKGLTPNGKIILQGNWKANSYFRQAADSAGIPPGMKVTVERNVQPLGRGFSYTDASRAGAPVVDSRITIEFKEH